MSDKTDSLALEQLRAIRAAQDDVKATLSDHGQRLNADWKGRVFHHAFAVRPAPVDGVLASLDDLRR